MDIKKSNVLIGFSVLFFYSVTLLMIKYPASYTSGSPVALFWSGVPVISLGRSFIFLLVALILSYSLAKWKLEFAERYVPIYLFTVAFIISLFFWNMPEVNNDYGFYSHYAKEAASNTKEVYPFGEKGPKYFVMPILDGLLFKLFGEERMIIQIFRTTLFALTAVVTYYIGKDLWDRRVGLVAGALLISFPYFLSMSHLMLWDVPLAFFVALSVFGVIRVVESTKWFPVLFIAVILALFTKKTGVVYLGFLVPSVLLVLFVRQKWRILKVAAPVLLLIVFMAVTRFSGFFKSVQSLYNVPIDYTSHGFFWFNLQYFLKSLPIVIGPVVALLAFGSVAVLIKKRDYMLWIPLLWMIIPIFVMLNPVFRHLIPAYPAYALASAVVLRELAERRINWKFIAYAGIIPSIFMALFIFPQIWATHVQVNVKDAAEYTNNLDIKDISLVTIRDPNFNWNGREAQFRNMYDYYSTANVKFFKVKKFQDTKPDVIVIVSTTTSSDIPKPLSNTLYSYYLSKVFSKGDYGFFAPAIFSVYLPQIEYHSRYPEFMQSIGKRQQNVEVYEVANPKAGLLNFITWTPSDRKILDKNVSVMWTVEAGEEPLEVSFYYRTLKGFFADERGEVEVPKGRIAEITSVIEPSQTMGTYIRVVPYEAEGRMIRIINVTFASEFYNVSISRDMQEFKF